MSATLFSRAGDSLPSHISSYTSSSNSLPILSAALLLCALSHTAWKSPLFPLFTAAVTWATLWILSWRCGKRLGRFAGGKTSSNRRPVLLAGSLLAAAVCDRVGGANVGWTKAAIPLAYCYLRELGVGGGGGEPQAGTEGRKRIFWVIAIASALATNTAGHDNGSLALAVCSVVFSALSYIFLDDCLAGIFGSGGHAQPLAEETWSTIVVLGKELGPYLTLGFALASVLFENVAGEIFRWQRYGFQAAVIRGDRWSSGDLAQIVGIAVVGAVKWMIQPVVVGKYSIVAAVFVDLFATVAVDLWIAVSPLKLLSAAVGVLGMGWYARNSRSVAGMQELKRERGPQVGKPTQLLLLMIAAGVLSLLCLFSSAQPLVARPSLPHTEEHLSIAPNKHPIPQLMADAEKRFTSMVARQSKTLPEAVAEYKRRYKMNPPPNFDLWFEFAMQKGTVLTDEFDTIYHTLKPYWGLSPAEIRKRAREMIGFKEDMNLKSNKLVHIFIRGKSATVAGQGPDWQKAATKGMIDKFVQYLPDMDLGFNIHDEPRVVVPHDILHQHIIKANEMTFDTTSRKVANTFTPLSPEEMELPPEHPFTPFNSFAHQSIWTHATLSCPPDSPVRDYRELEDSMESFTVQPLGFVANTTGASDICLQPSLEKRHGFFDRPNAFNVVQRLYPIFSQSKVSSFGDLLYPSPWYWDGKVKYTEEEDIAWEDKKDALFWRGSTTGGFSRNGGWNHQHRQRVVRVLESSEPAHILEQTQRDGQGDYTSKEVPWSSLKDLFDVHFSHIGQCDDADCAAMRAFFDVQPYSEQKDAWNYKYILDMDGNAFSGRFYAFLHSRSTVFKLAYFREWHDEWLVPWVHYVPLSLELEEAAEMMRYFRYEGEQSAKKIADAGREWARAVLRNDDLEVWFFRLLLEYGRVIDDNRETIGYAG